MLERIGAVSIILGTIIGIFGFCLLFVRTVQWAFLKSPRHRMKLPIILLLISTAMTGLPIAVNSVLTHISSLGPLESIVNGERHLTLTGWDRHDYSVIAVRTDTIVLQMANADVTDETTKYLTGLARLRELDLSNSQVTDSSLDVLAALPNLRDLRLARTKITDNGFRQHLLLHKNLMNLDLSGTEVASKTIQEWKAAVAERKALK